MAFQFKVAYTDDKTKIQPALDSGVIDEGDLVIIKTGDHAAALDFINHDKTILSFVGEVDEEKVKEIMDNFQDLDELQ